MKRFSNEDVRNSKFIVQFLPVHFVFYEKIAIFAALTEGSLRHCRIENWKETRSFLIRSPFDTYSSQTSNNQDFTICEMILCSSFKFCTRLNIYQFVLTRMNHLNEMEPSECIVAIICFLLLIALNCIFNLRFECV